MDSVESQVRQIGRQASRIARTGRYTEAAACHKKCAEHFDKLLAEKKLPLFQRSWEEQRRYHYRQAEILETFQRLGELNKEEKYLKDRLQVCRSKAEVVTRRIMSGVETAILQQLEEQDSLLLNLANQKKENKPEKSAAPVVKYTLKPKNDADLIEELQQVNANLRALVKELFEKLEKVEAEKRELQKKLEMYESCGMVLHTNPMDALDSMPSSSKLPELAPLEPPPTTF